MSTEKESILCLFILLSYLNLIGATVSSVYCILVGYWCWLVLKLMLVTVVFSSKLMFIFHRKAAKEESQGSYQCASLTWSSRIARSSDSFLFYHNVKEEIKHATAAKLEGFITMKTRSIHNSVSKWAERAKSRVKSIVEWIIIGGKNNRAVIERVDKRHRDHFWHKAHKKPKKKTKGRDSTIYSTMRQTSEWFYIPKEQLVLISEGTPISYIYSTKRN